MSALIKYQRPKLFPYQTQILDSDARFTVTEASTKVGKTTSHIIWLYEQALNCKEGQSVWWVAPVYVQAEIAFNRMKKKVTNQADESINHTFFKINQSKLLLTMPNGAKIHF